MLWEPGEGDSVCSEHFVSGKKAVLLCSPDYVFLFIRKKQQKGLVTQLQVSVA